MNDIKLKEVCKIGQGHSCCRYIVFSPDGFECAKNDLSMCDILDTRAEMGMMIAQGDNCEGEGEIVL